MEKDRIDVLMSVQYALEETGGVARWAIEAKPFIEDKTGGKVVVTFPKKKTDDESRLPPGGHFLGEVFKVPFRYSDTKYQASGRIKSEDVKTLLSLEAVKPHIVHVQEPIALPGIGVNGLINGLPRTEDGKTIPGLVAHVHSAKDHINLRTKFATRLIIALGYHPRIMRKFDRTLAASQATVDTWSQFWPVEYDIIPNGINTDQLTPDGPIIEKWKKDGKKTIFFTGRHDRRKGIEDLLLAYHTLRLSGRKDIQFKIGGEQGITDELKIMVKKLNIPDVEFLGKLPRGEQDPNKEDLVKAYRTADVFVGPSRDGEAFNRTNAEALSCGTMIVTTDISGHRGAFGKAEGGIVFVKPNDPEDLAKGIASVLDLSEEDRKSLGRQGRKYIVRNNSWPLVAGKLVTSVYQEVIVSKKMH